MRMWGREKKGDFILWSKFNSKEAVPFCFDDGFKKTDDAINSVSTQCSSLGAVQNRLEHTIKEHLLKTEQLLSHILELLIWPKK